MILIKYFLPREVHLNSHRLLPILIIVLSITSSNFSNVSAQWTDTQPNKLYLPIIFKDFDATWQFNSPISLNLQPLPNSNPYLIVDSSGRPHILWDTWSGNQTFIYHTYLTDQGWTSPIVIAQTMGESKLLNPPVAGNHNDIYLVWHNELNPGGPYRIMYAAWNGTKWGPEFELLGQGKSSSINGMVRLDQQGNPDVALIDSDGIFSYTTYYQAWTGSGFSPKQQITSPEYADFTWLDANNGIRFFGDSYNNSVHFSLWKNGSFLVNDLTFQGKIEFRNNFLDGTNNLHLTRLDSVPIPGGNVTGVYHQCLKNDFTWSTDEVLSGQDDIHNYVVGNDETLQPIIAWTTNKNQTINTTFWNGCNIIKQKQLLLPTMPNSYGWGDLVTVSSNAKAGKVCFLSEENYTTSKFWLTCTQ